MVAAPSPRTWVDLEIPPVGTLNQDLYATWYFLLNPPMVKARQTTIQTLTNGAYTYLNFQAEDVDTHGAHNATYPSRFTPKVPGYYVGYYGVSFKAKNTTADTTGRRITLVRVNGTSTYSRCDSLAPSVVNRNMVLKGNAWGPLYFNGTTDYIEVGAYHSAGVDLQTEVGSGTTDYEEQSEFYMRWWSS